MNVSKIPNAHQMPNATIPKVVLNVSAVMAMPVMVLNAKNSTHLQYTTKLLVAGPVLRAILVANSTAKMLMNATQIHAA